MEGARAAKRPSLAIFWQNLFLERRAGSPQTHARRHAVRSRAHQHAACCCCAAACPICRCHSLCENKNSEVNQRHPGERKPSNYLVLWPGCLSRLSMKPPRLARGIKIPRFKQPWVTRWVDAPVSAAHAIFTHFPNLLSPYPANPNDDVRDATSVDVVDKTGSIREGFHPLPT